jgi:RNA polymerase sigma-70 factor (ECF subfamily)
MDHSLRSKFDSLDFVQIMWASLFREPAKLRSFESPQDLISFLVTIARNKVVNELRRRTQYAKYNVSREMHSTAENNTGGELRQAAPTPSAVAIAKERWDHMLSNQNATVQSVVTLRLCGESFVDIAHKLQINERTARKAIARLTGDEESAL